MARNVGYALYAEWKQLMQQRGHAFRGNIHRDASMLKRIAEDIGEETARDIMLHYGKNYASPDLTWFIFNYDTVKDSLERRREDLEKRRQLREQTKKRWEEIQRRFED